MDLLDYITQDIEKRNVKKRKSPKKASDLFYDEQPPLVVFKKNNLMDKTVAQYKAQKKFIKKRNKKMLGKYEHNKDKKMKVFPHKKRSIGEKTESLIEAIKNTRLSSSSKSSGSSKSSRSSAKSKSSTLSLARGSDTSRSGSEYSGPETAYKNVYFEKPKKGDLEDYKIGKKQVALYKLGQKRGELQASGAVITRVAPGQITGIVYEMARVYRSPSKPKKIPANVKPKKKRVVRKK